MRFECSLDGVKDDSGVFFGRLPEVLERMMRHRPSAGDVIDIVLPFFRIDKDALEKIGLCMQSFVSRGALIRTLNFDPRKSRGRARMEHSVVGEAADIGDEGIAHIYHVLMNEHTQRTMSPDFNATHAFSCVEFSLESLHLGHCSIETTGVTFLAKLLPRLTNLQSLHLSDNEGIGSNFVTLAEQLQFMTKLRDINLTQCSLGSHGAKVLSAILPYMPSLEKLHLTYNHISAGSMERVCSQFSHLTNLRMLFLSYNALGNSSNTSKPQRSPKSSVFQSYLDSGLSFCRQLVVLHVHHCTLGESGTCFLLESAVSHKLTLLQSLRIDHNGVQPNSARFIAALLVAIGALKRVNQLWFRQVGLHFIEKSGVEYHTLDEACIPTSTSGMNDSNARAIIEELMTCERMTLDSASIDDDVLIALAITFQNLPTPRDWASVYREKTFLTISQTMFSMTIDLAESGSIKEIYESNIILHDKIGQGGFGTVYKGTWIHAQDPNELVAVKTVPFVPDDIDLESELSIMNKVKYERVDNLVHVKAIYFFEDHSMPSRQQSRMGIVMRWFEDGSLRDRLVRTQHHKHSSESLSWGDKLQLALDVCNGLGKLHEMALLHRDVKSDNVLLKMENGRLKGFLCDFGISASRESVNVRKQKGFGTLIFCAPELFVKDKGQSKFSVQSDVYAYGMFLYEVLTHHFPFERFVTECPDGSMLSVSKQHWSLHDLHKKANDQNLNLFKRCASKAATNLCIPEEIKRDCPVGYVELLNSCISHNASDRPQSMEQVRLELERIRTDLLASAVPAVGTRVLDIPVHFSEEQIAVMSHVLGTDLTGSSNVTSSIHTLIVSQTLSLTSDHFERKHEPTADAGLAARAESDSH